jgi:hypothetical protein
MNFPDRNSRLCGFALASAVLLTALPAQARINHPGIGGALSGGYFHGLPVRAQAPVTRAGDAEISGVAGGSCVTLRRPVQDPLGGTSVRAVRICN